MVGGTLFVLCLGRGHLAPSPCLLWGGADICKDEELLALWLVADQEKQPDSERTDGPRPRHLRAVLRKVLEPMSPSLCTFHFTEAASGVLRPSFQNPNSLSSQPSCWRSNTSCGPFRDCQAAKRTASPPWPRAPASQADALGCCHSPCPRPPRQGVTGRRGDPQSTVHMDNNTLFIEHELWAGRRAEHFTPSSPDKPHSYLLPSEMTCPSRLRDNVTSTVKRFPNSLLTPLPHQGNH